MLGRLQARELLVGLRRLSMLAVAHQMQRALLLVLRGLYRLHQAARGQYQRCRESRIERQPWTSRDRCHTLLLLDLQTEARIIMTNGPAGRLYVVATPIGNLGDLSPRRAPCCRTVR